MIRWPGVIKPGTIINDIGAHEDMIPTLLAAVGDTTVKEDLLKGKTIGDMTYKVHLDGYNLIPALKGEGAWPRHEFLYFTGYWSAPPLVPRPSLPPALKDRYAEGPPGGYSSPQNRDNARPG